MDHLMLHDSRGFSLALGLAARGFEPKVRDPDGNIVEFSWETT